MITNINDIWKKINTNNKKESKNVIDAAEAKKSINSVYFVEEGMTKKEFIELNKSIFEAPKSNLSRSQKDTLAEEVCKIINTIIDNGEFEEKKDMILGKVKYMNFETFCKVIDLLTDEDEKSKAQEQFNESMAVKEYCRNLLADA